METKDAFYSQLDMVLNKIPKEELLVLMGELNARVGMDSESWPSCVGKFGIGKINDNGQILELCTYHEICITNSFSRPNHTTKCPGDILDPSSGINST